MKPVKKTLAPLILLATLVTTSHALQGGSVMPEYVQFTPADNPQVVDLLTGDFNYTVPLGEVPGPYGSYPLSASYAAGVGPNQEATWVGLGWTINPGAINRTVRGVPDDQFHGGELTYVYMYQKTSGWGVSAGYTNGAFSLNATYNSTGTFSSTVSLGPKLGPMGLGVDFGTEGVGVSVKIGEVAKVGVGLGSNGVTLSAGFVNGAVGISGSITLSGSGYKGSSLGVSFDQTAGQSTVSAGIGLSHTSGNSIATSVNFGQKKESSSGEQMSSFGIEADFSGRSASISGKVNGYGASFSVPGSGIGVSSSGGASSDVGTANFGVVIPTQIGIFSFSYSRTICQNWVRQATSEYTYGYMYQAGPAIIANGKTQDIIRGGGSGSTSNNGAKIPWNWNYKGKQLDRVGNPSTGDVMPAWDLFAVATEGLSGTFHPYSMTEHRMVASLEKENETNNSDAIQTKFYLLEEDPDSHVQNANEFESDISKNAVTKYAYGYCYEDGSRGAFYDDFGNDASRKQAVENNICSKYAILRSKHLNEGARLIVSNPNTESAQYRSRMVFRFMSEGYFTPEAADRKSPDYKYGRFEVNPDIPQVDVDGVTYPISGGRKIDPILENNDNTGRLQGFKITNADGTQFFFTQPVRVLLHAEYTTNRAKGAPIFIDKYASAANDNFIDLIGNAFKDFASFTGRILGNADSPEEFFMDLGGMLLDGAADLGGAIANSLYKSPKFKDVCEQNKPDEKYSYSFNLKSNPYSTQWLLTEVRGPDFVLLDTSDMSKNIGYQVKLHYSEPTWYKWRFPFAAPNTEAKNLPNFRISKNGTTEEYCNTELYQGSFGVKELVYLSKIETATHEADFILNDSISEPRIDGKGWIQDWTGAKAVTDPNTAMPIFLNAIVEAKVTPVEGQTWTQKCGNGRTLGDEASATGEEVTCWYQRNVVVKTGGIYMNFQPTPEQKRRMETNNPLIMVSGMLGNSEKTYDFVDGPYGSGLVIGGLPKTELIGKNPQGAFTAPRVDSLLKPAGEKLAYGAVFIKFVDSLNLTESKDPESDVYRTGFRAFTCSERNENGNWDWSHPNCGTALGAEPSDDLISKTITWGGLQQQLAYPTGAMSQPLVIFNPFVETDGQLDNQTRYLKQIKVVDKRNQLPSRKFVFTYDNNIQPGTLNSYASNPDGSGRFQLGNGYPDITDANLTGLSGKLKLKTIQEFACGDANCNSTASLPPFRFAYNEEATTSLYRGEDFAGTVVNSSDPQDEFGFWNKFATHENHKVTQHFADRGAAAWSLNKVVEPSGGSMEVYYERDTYFGEHYDEEKDFLPVSWRRCNQSSAGLTNRLCIDFLPRRWRNYCDRNNKIRGEWTYTHVASPTPEDWEYIGPLQVGKNIYFNIDGSFEFRVGCGPSILGWTPGSCPRHASVGLVGSASILEIQNNTQISVPFLREDWATFGNDQELEKAPVVRTVVTEIPYDVIMDRMKIEGQKITDRHKGLEVNPIKGIAWLKRDRDTVKGGDLRVKKLIRRDIGLAQTTEYEYGVGEMAQYPDSVINTAFAERYSPSKASEALPTTVLPSVSRIVGISDDEIHNLPGSKVYYPSVSEYNVTTAGDEIANGKTVHNFITPESGLDLPDDAIPSFLRIKIKSAATYVLSPDSPIPVITVTFENSDHNPIASLANIPLKGKIVSQSPYNWCQSEVVNICRYTKSMSYGSGNGRGTGIPPQIIVITGKSLVYSHEGVIRSASSSDLAAVEFMRIQFQDGQISTTPLSFTSKRLPGVDATHRLNKFSEIESGLYLNQLDLPNAVFTVGNMKTTSSVPILLHTSDPMQEFDPNGSNNGKSYVDLSGFMGRPTTTSQYRFLGRNSQGNPVINEKSKQNDPLILAQYRLISQDSVVYGLHPNSMDNRFYANANTTTEKNKFGVDEEKWQYMRKANCNEGDRTYFKNNCSFKSGSSLWHGYKDADLTWKSGADPKYIFREVTYSRMTPWVRRTFNKSGFNNSTDQNDYIITKLENHKVDPFTGTPLATVTYSRATDANVPGKATLLTPAYSVDHDLAREMFKRNMLKQSIREDAFTWTNAVTRTNTVGGTPIDFASDDLLNSSIAGPALTQVKFTPFTKKFVKLQGTSVVGYKTLTDKDMPILGLGSFTPKFYLESATGYDKAKDATKAFEPNFALTDAKSFVKNWAGLQTTRVGFTLKATEEKDIYGHYLSHRFDPTGFHQIAVFNNSPYDETAVFTTESRAGFPNTVATDQWAYSAATIAKEGKFLKITNAFSLSHPLQWKPGKVYRMEAQIQLSGTTDKTCNIQFGVASGNQGPQSAVILKPGLNSYSTTLLNSNPVSSIESNNQFRLNCPESSLEARISYLRVYPDNGESATYVYNDRGNLIQVVNENNLSTYFEYDLFGEVTGIKNDDGLMYSAHKREWTNVE